MLLNFLPRFAQFARYFSAFVLWWFVFAGSIQATTYYVDNVLGLDANDGLGTNSAWKTLSKATSIASAGDTVYVINNGPTKPFNERLAPARSGTSENHIRFIGYNGSPYILGTINYTHSVSSGWIWSESAVSGEYYLTNNGGNPGITQARMLATATTAAWDSNGVDALTNRSAGTLGSLAVGQWGWGNNDSLGYNTIYYRPAVGESDITAIHIEGGEDGAQHRNPILVAWQYIDIENFKVRFSNHHGILNQTLANYVSYNNVDSSYTGRSGISNGIFTNMTVTNSRFDHNGMISTVRADYSGIQLGGTTNSVIRNNVISNGNNDSGINIKAASNGNVISNNVIFNNAQHGIDISTSSINNVVYNNTVYENAEQGINVETTSTGTLIKNNIMANNQVYQLSVFDSGSTSGLVLANNLYYFNPSSTNMIRFAGSFYSMDTFATYQTDKSQDVGSLAVNPLFLNSSGNYSLVDDFKLRATSQAINTGASVAITSDYLGNSVPQGSAPDMGAFEFLTPAAPSMLAQYESDGVTTIASGDMTDEASVVLKFSMSSENSSDSITPQIEIQESDVPFSNTATNTGSALTYSGTPVAAEIIVTGLSASKTYHWQARSVNAAGGGVWVSKGGSPDFGITLPVPTPTNSPSHSEENHATQLVLSSSDAQHYCSDSAPESRPDLFQITAAGASAKLYFSPIANTQRFFLSYGISSTAEGHGVEFELGREGVQNFTVNHLKPYTTYYFKIRGQNGCAIGEWSDVMSAKTGSAKMSKYLTYYRSAREKFSNMIAKVAQVNQVIAKPSKMINLTEKPVLNGGLVQDETPTKIETKALEKKCYLFGRWLCF